MENRRKAIEKRIAQFVHLLVYTSLHVCTQPDQGKAIRKLIKHVMPTFQKYGIESKEG
jgi:hypothetical protein